MTQYKRKHPIKEQARNYLLSDYVNTILDETGIDIRIKSRIKDQQDLQKIFCKYIRWNLGYSLTFIANYLGKTHATIKNSVDKYDDLYKTDEDFKRLADHLIGRFQTIDSIEETMLVKKALIDLIEKLTEKDRARIYAVAVDILEGKQTVSITKKQVIKLIDQQADKFLVTDE